MSRTGIPPPGLIRTDAESDRALCPRTAQRRARRSAENPLRSPMLPPAFDGFTILHLSDLHVDLNAGAMGRSPSCWRARLRHLRADRRLSRQDLRRRSTRRSPAWRGCAPASPGRSMACSAITTPSAWCPASRRWASACCSTSIRDDRARRSAHPSRRHRRCRLLLGRQHREGGRRHSARRVLDPAVAHAGDLSPGRPCRFRPAARGHTHGGQICLPGGIPITLDSRLPRRYGAGAWVTRAWPATPRIGSGSSVVPVRFNCPPEVMLHRCTGHPRPDGGSRSAPVANGGLVAINRRRRNGLQLEGAYRNGFHGQDRFDHRRHRAGRRLSCPAAGRQGLSGLRH